jgi:arginase
MKKIRLVEVRSEVGAGTRGASMGIDALRTACFDKKSNYFTRFTNIQVPTYNDALFEEPIDAKAKFIESVYDTCVNVSREVSDVLRKKYFPIVLAGDHSSAAGTIAGIKRVKRGKRVGVIWIDAHTDLQTPYTTDSGNMHGMPLSVALNEDNLDVKTNNLSKHGKLYWEKLKNMSFRGAKIEPQDIVFIAARSIDEPEQYLVEKHGIKNIPLTEVKKKGVTKVCEEVLEYLDECDNIYISFDVDSMDPKISKGTGTPVEKGLSFEEARDLNTCLIEDRRVCCWEMVEVNPTLDSENAMAEAAFDILEAVTDSLWER